MIRIARTPFRFAPVLLLAGCLAPAAFASTFSVGPVRIHVPAHAPSATVEVRSGDFRNPVLLQATPYAWTQKDGERVLVPTEDLQVTPSVLRLEPGEVRTLRLLATADASEPRYFRLRVEEVETELTAPGDENALAFLQAFDLPVFVEPSGATADLRTRARVDPSGETVHFELTNRGSGYAVATKLCVSSRPPAEDPEPGATCEQSDAAVAHVRGLYYLLPGQSRTVELALGPTSDTALSDGTAVVPAATEPRLLPETLHFVVEGGSGERVVTGLVTATPSTRVAAND